MDIYYTTIALDGLEKAFNLPEDIKIGAIFDDPRANGIVIRLLVPPEYECEEKSAGNLCDLGKMFSKRKSQPK